MTRAYGSDKYRKTFLSQLSLVAKRGNPTSPYRHVDPSPFLPVARSPFRHFAPSPCRHEFPFGYAAHTAELFQSDFLVAPFLILFYPGLPTFHHSVGDDLKLGFDIYKLAIE